MNNNSNYPMYPSPANNQNSANQKPILVDSSIDPYSDDVPPTQPVLSTGIEVVSVNQDYNETSRSENPNDDFSLAPRSIDVNSQPVLISKIEEPQQKPTLVTPVPVMNQPVNAPIPSIPVYTNNYSNPVQPQQQQLPQQIQQQQQPQQQYYMPQQQQAYPAPQQQLICPTCRQLINVPPNAPLFRCVCGQVLQAPAPVSTVQYNTAPAYTTTTTTTVNSNTGAYPGMSYSGKKKNDMNPAAGVGLAIAGGLLLGGLFSLGRH